MQTRTIKTTTRHRKANNLPVIETKFDVPETLAEAGKLWGEDVVLSHAVRSSIVSLQSYIRGLVEKTETDDKGKKTTRVISIPDSELQTKAAAYVPELRAPGKTAVDKVAELVKNLSPEQLQEAIAAANALREQEDEDPDED